MLSSYVEPRGEKQLIGILNVNQFKGGNFVRDGLRLGEKA